MKGNPVPAMDPVGEAARRVFGVDYLYPVQRFVISNVLEGTGQIVILPTGAGKSLCFQVPALFLTGPTLVLLPLLSLISDQLRRLSTTGLRVGSLRGGMTRDEREMLFAAARSGSIRIILATPESCMVPAHLRALHACGVRHLVVDEAHCICEWGDSFRPAYRQVGTLARALAVPVVSAFTATASPAVIERISNDLFGGGDARVVAGSADRPNITYAVQPLLSRSRAFVELARSAARPLLIFCRTRSNVEVAARTIRRRCPWAPVRFYHAGLTREERAGVERWFLQSSDGILAATCAYGLGVDKPDIRTVVHADIPPSVEAYLQESGRAGRDGLPSAAVLVTSPEDDAFLGRQPDPVSRQRYVAMLVYARGNGCRRNELLRLIGQPPVACSGCDACSGSVARSPPGMSEVLGFVWRHNRRFTAARTASILCARPGPRALRDQDDSVPGFGGLDGWNRDDAQEVIRSLVASGHLKCRRGILISQTVALRPGACYAEAKPSSTEASREETPWTRRFWPSSETGRGSTET